MKKSSDRKDKLERFVRDNREAFDTFELNDTFWERIEKKLDSSGTETENTLRPFPPSPESSAPTDEKNTELSARKKTLPLWSRIYFDWRIAASVIVVVGFSYFYYLNNEYGVTRDPKVALTMPAYAKEFNQYSLTINKKRNQLIQLTSDNPELYREFSGDLDRLEKSYQNLRSDLSQSPDQEALVQAMIKNLQWQIDLLNQQLLILQQLKNTNEDEKANHTVNI